MPTEQQNDDILTGNRPELVLKLSQLWLQLAILTRSLIVSTAGDLGDIKVITDRLTLLPKTFSEVLDQYFDPEETAQFQELLQEHIAAVSALIIAEKNDDRQTVNQETVFLYDNANRIAAYLMNINPFWSKEQWSELLNDYIEMFFADLVARLTNDFTKEIDVFEDLQSQAMKLADYMARGIAQKFYP